MKAKRMNRKKCDCIVGGTSHDFGSVFLYRKSEKIDSKIINKKFNYCPMCRRRL